MRRWRGCIIVGAVCECVTESGGAMSKQAKCPTCGGSGKVWFELGKRVRCKNCGGRGRITNDYQVLIDRLRKNVPIGNRSPAARLRALAANAIEELEARLRSTARGDVEHP